MMNRKLALLIAALALATPAHARTMRYDTRLVCLPDKPRGLVKYVKIQLKVNKENTDNFALGVVHHGWTGALWDRFGQYENLNLKHDKEDTIAWTWEGITKQNPKQTMQGTLVLGKSDDRLHYVEISWANTKKNKTMGDVNISQFSECVEDVESQEK
jgi:hypothetical protein